MNQEIRDFNYFKENQLHSIDFESGKINSTRPCWPSRIFFDVGSINEDGYVRMWCGERLRMQHRLIYYLWHGCLPAKGYEIDHISDIRSENGICNLRILSKALNNTGCKRVKGKHYTDDIIGWVCRLLSTTTLSDSDIANESGVSRGTVRDIKVRRSRCKISKNFHWKHRGY